MSGLGGLFELLYEMSNTPARRYEPIRPNAAQNVRPQTVVPSAAPAPEEKTEGPAPEERIAPQPYAVQPEEPVFTQEQLVSGLIMAEILGRPVAQRRGRGRHGLG